MDEGPDLGTETETRTLNRIQSDATTAETLSEAAVEVIVRALEGHGESWQTALSTLETVVEAEPDSLEPIVPALITEFTTVRPSFDELSFRAEHSPQEWYATVASEPEIGVPLRVTWVLDELAQTHPEILSTHADVLAERYTNEERGPYPDHFRLVVGRLAAVAPDGLPVETIRSDLTALAERGDFYGTEAATILEDL